MPCTCLSRYNPDDANDDDADDDPDDADEDS